MKIGIAVLCRMTSDRLPGKALAEINGKKAIQHVIDRVIRAASEYDIVLATSSESTDDELVEYFVGGDIKVFRGNLEDPTNRLICCAEKFGWDFIARINGDRIFLDPDILRSMLAIASTGSYDLVTNLPGKTFPSGMGVEIIRASFLSEIMKDVKDPYHREHVTTWLYENPQLGNRHVFVNHICPESADKHFALDTPDDLVLARKILNLSNKKSCELRLPEVFNLLSQLDLESPWQGLYGPLLISEIGGNHEGDFEKSKQLLDLAIRTQVDSIKFQLYKGDTLVSARESPDRTRHFKNFELTREEHIQLAKICLNAGITYSASVWDLEMLDWIDPYLKFYKVGSGDLTALSILKSLAERGKPILLSTGLSTLDEIVNSVKAIQDVDTRYNSPEMLCLMQCTSMYPIPDSEAQLQVMKTLKLETGLGVGYSDHTVGTGALLTAAAMGADVLEFHFTDQREGKVFRDHKVSLTSDEVLALQEKISKIMIYRGNTEKKPQDSEIENDHVRSFRRAVYLKKPKSQGEAIESGDIILLRPEIGTPANREESVIGAKVLRDISPLQAITKGEDYE